VGKSPILIPEGVTVDIQEGLAKVKGPKGELHLELPASLRTIVLEHQVVIESTGGLSSAKAFHGLLRTQISNMILGVSTGFQKQLAIHGVGYNARTTGDTLTLQLGYSHPIIYQAPPGIRFTVEDQPKGASGDLQCFVFVRGCDRELVGQVASTLRAFRPPEPYKGKGIRYQGEHVRRKAGKAAAATGGAKG
jgi:large subunit ribosomal protein L6